MQQIAGAIRWTIWTTAELRIEECAELRTKMRRDAAREETRLLVVLKFFVPGHLNRFQLSFVR
jgi:hypothetical protein